MYKKKPDRIYYDPAKGRTMQHEHYSTRIYWSSTMLDYLKRNYAHTLNEELAGWLGVSLRSVIRKARELELEKDPMWLAQIYEERRKIAHAVNRSLGYPGRFRKGQHANPAGEFKPGQPRSEDMKRKQGNGLRRYYKLHPSEAREKSLKGWRTRRANNRIAGGYPDELILIQNQ